MTRRIFIGDLHGCAAALDRLLDAVDFEVGRDLLLPVGDLVNKGPDSIGVLRRLSSLDARPVLGNHDLLWLRSGRIEDPQLDGWLRAQPLLREFDDLILVHAGLSPRWDRDDLRRIAREGEPWASEDARFAVAARYCTAEGVVAREDWPPPEPPFLPWDEHYRGARRVVFGHWARRGLDLTPRVVALDSGCIYGGPLSAWIAEEDRVVQVPGFAG